MDSSKRTYLVMELVQLSRYFNEIELRLMMRVSKDFCVLVRRELEQLRRKEEAQRANELLEIQREISRRFELRSSLISEELEHIDKMLGEKFSLLHQKDTHRMFTSDRINDCGRPLELDSWCQTHPAQLDCSDYELGNLNLAHFHNKVARSLFTAEEGILTSVFGLMKTFLLSNPALLNNRDYTGNGGTRLTYFPFYTLFTKRCFYSSQMTANHVYMKQNYKFLRFCLLLQKVAQDHFEVAGRLNEISFLIEQCFSLLTQQSCPSSICKCDKITADPATSWYRGEILKLLLSIRRDLIQLNPTLSADYWIGEGSWKFLRLGCRNRSLYLLMILWRDPGVQEELEFTRLLRNTKENGFAEFILQLFRHLSSLRILLGSSDFRDPFLRHCRARGILFRLIESKNRKGIEVLWKYSGEECAQLVDEEGNNPLGAICKVRGCNQRIAEFFIRNGCSLEHKNHQGFDCRDVAIASRNKRLLRFLAKEGYLSINSIPL